MKSFHFKSTSLLHFTVILAAGVCLMAFLIVDLKLHLNGHPLLFASIVIMMFLIYLLAQKNSKQIVSIGMNSSYLHLSWVKLPAYIVKENKIIPWTQIREYHHHPDEEQDAFEIILINSEKIKFFINHSKNQQDSFNEFYVYFTRTFHHLDTNEAIALETALSNLPKNFYQTTFGIGIAFLLGILAISLTIYALNSSHLPFSWRTLGAALSFALAYIQLVWMHNKKKKTDGQEEIFL